MVECPGGDMKITFSECPFCHEEVEFFTGDTKVKCSGCGRSVPRDPADLSCLAWCPAASQCYDSRNAATDDAVEAT